MSLAVRIILNPPKAFLFTTSEKIPVENETLITLEDCSYERYRIFEEMPKRISQKYQKNTKKYQNAL